MVFLRLEITPSLGGQALHFRAVLPDEDRFDLKMHYAVESLKAATDELELVQEPVVTGEWPRRVLIWADVSEPEDTQQLLEGVLSHFEDAGFTIQEHPMRV